MLPKESRSVPTAPPEELEGEAMEEDEYSEVEEDEIEDFYGSAERSAPGEEEEEEKQGPRQESQIIVVSAT